ncbi:MAG: thioredoxin fold domain-containing protein [Hyphomicrobiales bacterium]|nr:thioredoxin fold domain-containing protein [Hyphomicrobiales bacterium]
MTGKESQGMIAWRIVLIFTSVILMASGPVRADRHQPILPAPELNDEGLHARNWFYNSGLDLRQDLAATRKQGKRLVIFWEQQDCLYCNSMYQVNLRIPRIVEKINNSFNVIRLNIWGKRKVTDLDGTIQSEEELAGKYNIIFTPTVQFLPESLEIAAGRNGSKSEDFRFEGYFKPFHYYFMFHYVEIRGYLSQPSFQRWLGDIGRSLQENNIKYDIWADLLPPELPDQY